MFSPQLSGRRLAAGGHLSCSAAAAGEAGLYSISGALARPGQRRHFINISVLVWKGSLGVVVFYF